jgi:hypothetical protein
MPPKTIKVHNTSILVPDAHCKIRSFSGITKTSIQFVVDFYKDLADCLAGHNIHPGENFRVEGAAFEQYFSEEVLKAEGVSYYTQATEYLKTLPQFTDTTIIN